MHLHCLFNTENFDDERILFTVLRIIFTNIIVIYIYILKFHFLFFKTNKTILVQSAMFFLFSIALICKSIFLSSYFQCKPG